MIFAFAFPKGGVGKSTLAAHFAAYLARTSNTLLVDGDPFFSVADWHANRVQGRVARTPETLDLLTMTGLEFRDKGRQAMAGYDNVVIDVPGQDNYGLRGGIGLADRVIMPLKPSGYDTPRVRKFLDIVEQARKARRAQEDNPAPLELRAVINMLHPSSSDAALREFLESRGIVPMKQAIRYRTIYPDVAVDGRTVEDARPRNAAATFEMRKLCEEIEAWPINIETA